MPGNSTALVGPRSRPEMDYWERQTRNITQWMGALDAPLVRHWLHIRDTSSIKEANQALDRLVLMGRFGSLNLLTANLDDMRAYAGKLASWCEKLAKGASRPLEADTYKQVLELHQLCPSKPVLTAKAVRQLANPRWWQGRIRRQQGRAVEAVCRELNLVRKQDSIYCSRLGVQGYESNTLLNRQVMEATELENEIGEVFSLAELSDLSVSNPRLRRIELMVRCAGFERHAKQLGYVGMFYTLTCPSKYHATHSNSGQPNQRFGGASPKEAQDYLCQVWARFRAWAARQGFGFFGFRVAEPHHDGTPHWHLLLFIAPEHEAPLSQGFRHYALQVDPDEKGAQANRFEAVKIKQGINPKTGQPYSAAGYIAKYISKNIDAHGVDADEYGTDGVQAANHTTAWARRNGIRQFQQFGGPSVGLWRECRRLIVRFQQDAKVCDSVADLKKLIEQLAQQTGINAADAWAHFCRAPEVEQMKIKKKTALEEVKYERVDWLTGEITLPGIQEKTGVYGDPIETICGIDYQGETLLTRVHQWHKKPKGADAPPWSSINNCTGDFKNESQPFFTGCQSEIKPSGADVRAPSSVRGEPKKQRGHGFYGQSTASGGDGDGFNSRARSYGTLSKDAAELPRSHGGHECRLKPDKTEYNAPSVKASPSSNSIGSGGRSSAAPAAGP